MIRMNKHYGKRKSNLNARLYKIYDKIEEIENQLTAARAKKMVIEADKLTADNIYNVLIYFDKLYSYLGKRQLMETLIPKFRLEKCQPSSQWLKAIKFKLPIIEEDMDLSLDSNNRI